MENESAARVRSVPLGLLGIWTYLCNLFDYAYTLRVLRRVPGVREGNPFFALLLRSPALAFAFKILGVGAMLWLLYRLRERPLARFGLCLTALAYAATVAYEILMLPIA